MVCKQRCSLLRGDHCQDDSRMPRKEWAGMGQTHNTWAAKEG